MMVEPSHIGWNRAAMHERDGNGRCVPKAPSVRIPDLANCAVPLPASKRVLVHATVGAAVQTASQQTRGWFAAMILPRWMRFRSTFS
jgi:hypothetical protein